MNQSHFSFQENNNNWVKNIKDYEYSKQNLEWKFNPKPQYITHKQMAYNDIRFNPITQKYLDKSIENEVRINDDKNLKNTLVKNYDKSFQYKQTFDIITLENKLKDLNYEEEIKKKKIRNVLPDSKVPYNIISNISLNNHNIIPPNLRKKYPEFNEKKKQIITKSYLYKDYDIINNKYKVLDEEKQKIDKEIEKLTASKQINNRKDFDFIKCRFYNDELNKIEDEKMYKKKGNLIPYRGQKYNPINMKTYDTDNLNNDDKESLKLQNKFKLRKDLEIYYINQEEKNLEIQKNKHCDYRNYADIDKRGYNIINFEKSYNKYQDNFPMKKVIEPWDYLKKNVGNNETISKKKLFINILKKQELDERLKQFKIIRNESVQNLMNIKDEERFKIKELIPKINNNNNKQINKSYSQPHLFMNKEDWFNGEKTIFMEDMKYPKKSLFHDKEKID